VKTLVSYLKIVFLAMFAVPFSLLSGCSGSGSSNGPSVISVEVTPTNPSIANGTTQQFTAMVLLSDGSKTDVTQLVTWTSSDAAIATINSAGLAQSNGVGPATIKATYQGNIVGTAQLTVTAAVITGLAVTPAAPAIANGTTQQFVATATFSDNTNQPVTAGVTWTSSDATVATISNAAGSNGLAQSLKQGATTIAAAYLGKNASAVLTVTPATLVSISVTPAAPSIAKGTTQQFAATATFTDTTHQDVTSAATWTSSDATVATISNAAGSNGLAQSLRQGMTSIAATYQGQQDSTPLTVTPAVLTSLSITPANPTVAKGFKQAFTANGTYSDGTQQNLTQAVTWASSDTTVATIDNATATSGQATTLAQGTTTISAASGTVNASTVLTVGAAVLTSIAVTPDSPSAAKGTTQQFTATGSYSDNTNQNLTAAVTWSSADASIASISNAAGSQGKASAKNLGTTTITAASGSISGMTTLKVTGAVLQSLQVTPANPNVAIGFKRQFTATGIYSDSTNRDVTAEVTWLSTNSNVASVSNAAGSNGVATGLQAGSTTIAAMSGTIQNSTTLTVTSATLSSISVTPANKTLPKGSSLQYTAMGTFSDSSTQDLTTQVAWTSSDNAIASIDAKGLAFSSADTGTVTIKATSGTVVGSTNLTAHAADYVAVTVTPDGATIPNGKSQQYKAVAKFTDGSNNVDVTNTVTWSSSSAAVAVVSNVAGSQGLATGKSKGATTIAATVNDINGNPVSGSVSLNVTDAILNSLAITSDASSNSVPKGVKVHYTATGTYSDGSVQDLTTAVTWTSADDTAVSISNAAGTQGVASTLKVTSPNKIAITAATRDANGAPVNASTDLTVTAAVLKTIAVTPANATVGRSASLQYTATGIYSDGTTAPLTTQVNWSASDTAIADISNSAGSQGLALGKAQGSVTIKAVDSASGVSGQTGLTVGPAALTSITITPPDTANGNQVPAGYSKPFKAIGNYADGSHQDLTASSSWSSSSASATVGDGNAAGAKGLVTGVSAGTSDISVSNGAITSTATVIVTAATLSSISVTPANVTLSGPGKTQQYTATATFSDGETLDVTTQVTWNSSNTSAATISNAAGSKGLATTVQVVAPTTTTIAATVGGKTGSTTLTVTF
jgi:uncharacterized protein YjdB